VIARSFALLKRANERLLFSSLFAKERMSDRSFGHFFTNGSKLFDKILLTTVSANLYEVSEFLLSKKKVDIEEFSSRFLLHNPYILTILDCDQTSEQFLVKKRLAFE